MNSKIPTKRPSFSRRCKTFLWILVLLSTIEFVWRGPVRYLQTSYWTDLSQNYAATRLWLRGQNFARPENFINLWKNELGATLGPGVRTHLAPPLGTLVLLAPVAILPWSAARLLWLLVLVAAVGATIFSLARSAGFRLGEPRSIAFVACCLALAPFHTGIAAANETILVVALCTLGIWAAGENRELAAGLLFGAACSLKPHIGSFLVLYYIVRHRWRLLTAALAFTALLASVPILWLRICGVSWARDYFHNAQVLAGQNRIDDFTSANPIRFMLINLQVPLYSYTHGATSANILALATGGLLVVIWIYLTIRATAREVELLALAAIAVIGLLPLYHRLYDASVLVIPICWCLSQSGAELNRVARIVLIIVGPFLIPGAALLQHLEINGYIPSSWRSSLWWQGLIMPHQTWLLFVLALVLLTALGQKRCLKIPPSQ